MADLFDLARIAAKEFADIVVATTIMRDKLRVLLQDGSYIDFWWSGKIPGRFAHHWERIHVDGTIYRHDNMPHPRWRNVTTRKVKITSWIVFYLRPHPKPLHVLS